MLALSLLALMNVAAAKPVALARAGSKWTLAGRAYDPNAVSKACKQVEGKVIGVQAGGADWGELRAAIVPLFECLPSGVQLGAVTLAPPSKQAKPIVIVHNNDVLWLWHEGARVKLDASDLGAVKPLAAQGLAVYFAPTLMPKATTLDRLATLGALELSVNASAGVRVTAGETARAEPVEKPSGLLVRTFGAAEMPVAGAAPPPSWISGGPKRCTSRSGAPVIWAAGVVSGVFDPAEARTAAETAARAELVKFLEATTELKKGKTFVPPAPSEIAIVDRHEDAASKATYALAELATPKKKGEELDTCLDADPGVTWTWQAVDAEGGAKRVMPEWTKALPAGIAGAAQGLHFRVSLAAKTPYDRAVPEAAFAAALQAALAKTCARAAVDAKAVAAAEWFADYALSTWSFRAVLPWAALPDAAFAGCARTDGEVALGRPPPMQNAPGWVTRGASETMDAFFVATRDGDQRAVWTAVRAKMAPALPETWPSASGAEFLVQAIGKDASGTQTWRDRNYGVDYALRRVTKLAVAQRVRECLRQRACEALPDEKKAIEELGRGVYALLEAQAASAPAK